MEILETYTLNEYTVKCPEDEQRGKFSEVKLEISSNWPQEKCTHIFYHSKAFNNVLKYMYDKDHDLATNEIQKIEVKTLFKRCNFVLIVPRVRKKEKIELKNCSVAGTFKIIPRKAHLFDIKFSLKHELVPNNIVETLAGITDLGLQGSLDFDLADLFSNKAEENDENE